MLVNETLLFAHVPAENTLHGALRGLPPNYCRVCRSATQNCHWTATEVDISPNPGPVGVGRQCTQSRATIFTRDAILTQQAGGGTLSALGTVPPHAGQRQQTSRQGRYLPTWWPLEGNRRNSPPSTPQH